LQRRPCKVRSRCVAAPLADVDSDAKALVARPLDGLDLLFSHGDGQSCRFADFA